MFAANTTTSLLCIINKCLLSGVFDILVYTDKDLEVPSEWGESAPGIISNSEEVRLRSFTTTIHKVEGMVAYKLSA